MFKNYVYKWFERNISVFKKVIAFLKFLIYEVLCSGVTEKWKNETSENTPQETQIHLKNSFNLSINIRSVDWKQFWDEILKTNILSHFQSFGFYVVALNKGRGRLRSRPRKTGSRI